MELLEAIERFNSHEKAYSFKLESGKIIFCEIFDKANWTPKGFAKETVEEVIEEYPLKSFEIPIPVGMKTPTEEIVRNITVIKHGSGITSRREDRLEQTTEDRLKDEVLNIFILNAEDEHREFYREYLLKQ